MPQHIAGVVGECKPGLNIQAFGRAPRTVGILTSATSSTVLFSAPAAAIFSSNSLSRRASINERLRLPRRPFSLVGAATPARRCGTRAIGSPAGQRDEISRDGFRLILDFAQPFLPCPAFFPIVSAAGGKAAFGLPNGGFAPSSAVASAAASSRNAAR